MSDENHQEIDDHTGVETTGHEWDGIKELNNPLPRWWLWIFYASVIYSIVYWVLMPAWPAPPGVGGTNTPGLRGHSDRANVVAELSSLDAQRAGQSRALLETPLDQIEGNRDLLQFALAAGESAFGDNCATCHGAGGRGPQGYPALVDDAWLWDGTLEGIEYTLNHGIRHDEDPETRFSLMPAFGADGLLEPGQIEDMVEYVVDLSGRDADPDAVARAGSLWQAQCATCHGADGRGDPSQGAPNLTDAIWLYGGERGEIRETIYNARNSHMPAWQDRLEPETIRALTIYVHTLGGGD